MSSFSDVSGTEEEKEKENAPKAKVSMRAWAWACIKEVYDCHLFIDGELSLFWKCALTHLYL